MIAFECSSCGKALKVKDELAGKKVKCPGCQKPVGVPQPAASISPPPSVPAEERTLPPKASAGGEERTLPPKEAGKKESLSDAGGLTDLGAAKRETTQAFPAAEHSPGLTDFLAPAEQPDELGRLGGFRILKILGHGGMGVVFLGEDPKLGRKVAIKAMLPDLAESKSAQQRFLREARAAAALEHDHIVAIHHVGEERGAPFIVMPFLQGEPLDERLKRDALPVTNVLRIGRETAEGLSAAHKKGMIHRDVKPANIWLEGDKQRVKILDFGLARAAAEESHLTQTGAIVGTPAYMAPEQAGGEKVDHRCDLFSLGCVLYRMCTGAMPFKGKDSISTLIAVASHDPPPPASLNADVPAELSDLVMKLLAKKPEDRLQSAQAVADALAEMEKSFSGEPQATRTGKMRVAGKTQALQKSTAGNQKAKRRLPLLIGGSVLGAGVLGLLLFLLLRPGNDQTSRERQRPEDDSKQTAALATTFTNSLGMKFMLIPVGKFTMGSTKDEIDAALKLSGKDIDSYIKSEGPAHPVEITQPFYMGETEVTFGQFRQFVEESKYNVGDDRWKKPGWEQTDKHPVVWVDWKNANDFCVWLSEKEASGVASAPRGKYRLPTEAEWEYSCRAGTKTRYSFGDDEGESLRHAWISANSQGKAQPVKGLDPNPWGLHDMHGNVWEWCQDEYDANYYKTSPPKDPPGPSAGGERVVRGASWHDAPVHCRSAFRNPASPGFRNDHIGFRVMLVLPAGGKEPVLTKPPVEKKTEAPPPTFKNSLGMEFVLVPKGKSWLGGGGGKPGDKEVEIKEDFYLGKYEVTQEEWEKVLGARPSHFSRVGAGKDAVKEIPDAELKRFPVEMVSWDDAQKFLAALNNRDKQEGWVYRLPTEVEWEYACRSGPMVDKSESAFDVYFEKPSVTLLPEQANFNHDKRLWRTCKVGSYPANRLGLYDMHGNVWEWCDNAGAAPRVYRGGGWGAAPEVCRAENRRGADTPSHRDDSLGLRLARVPVGKEIVKVIALEEKKPPVESKQPAFKNSLGMEFVLVPKGKSWLRGGGGKPGDKEVEIKEDFYLGKYEVTQEEWEKVTGFNPSSFKAVAGVSKEDQKRFPVETVSWDDCQAFIDRLNKQVKEAGWVYRLPKETEWEYACRGGLSTKYATSFDFYLPTPTNQLQPDQANFEHGKGLKRTCKVGSYPPNRLGL